MQTQVINIIPENVTLPECKRVVTFRPFYNYIKEVRDKTNSHKKYFFNYVIEQFDKQPKLLEAVALEDIKHHTGILELIYNSLSRMLEDEDVKFWALSMPMKPTVFYGTNAFYNLLSKIAGSEIKQEIMPMVTEQLQGNPVEFIYAFILEKYYNSSFFFSKDILHSLENTETGLTHYYKANLDTRFIEIFPEKDLPEFKLDILQAGGFSKAERLKMIQEVLPLEFFRFEGFGIVMITDISVKYAVESIKNFILNNSFYAGDDYFAKVIHWLKIIVGNNDIEFGLLPALRVNNKLIFNEGLYVNSIMVSSAQLSGMEESTYMELIDRYFNNPRLLFFTEITPEEEEKHEYLKVLHANGIFSYALLPVYFANSLVGVLEVYCRKKILLDEALLTRLDPVIPLLSQLLKNGIHEFYDSIEKVIKQKFTSVQPSVQWKFNEAAWHYIRDLQHDNKPAEIEEIDFHNVYPLYGAIDIRNSTVERNTSLNNDLQVQFTVLIDMLEKLKAQTAFGLIDEKIFLAKKWLGELSGSTEFTEQILIDDFLENNITPFLLDFKSGNEDLGKTMDIYFNAINNKNGIAYKSRSELEKSMNTVISSVNNYLDKMQIQVQQAYPCYFEKFRTDGVEYDIYIGQSIAPEKPFSDIYLKNLRLLQLSSMASIAKFTAAISAGLSKQVQTTQLIFIHSQPIDIKFRKDEKRFDVEGAYNIRYHIVKKRIDKVLVRETDERLTQPNKIALVYINQQDASEYLGYIKYLQEQDVLTDDLEELELEELQGVNGLKALRVGVVLDSTVSGKQ